MYAFLREMAEEIRSKRLRCVNDLSIQYWCEVSRLMPCLLSVALLHQLECLLQGYCRRILYYFGRLLLIVEKLQSTRAVELISQELWLDSLDIFLLHAILLVYF
jgi:hypothetical protein